MQESSNQEQTHGRKRKVVLGGQHVSSDKPSQSNIASAGQSQPKRMRFTEEHRLSGNLPHVPATARDSAEGKQDIQDAAATLTTTSESGQFTPPDHNAEMLPAENESQQDRLHQSVLKAYPNRRDILAALFAARTPADRMAVRGPPEPPLAEKLNPNNAAFDPVFTAENRARRAQEDPHYLYSKVRKQQFKLLKRVHWVQKSAFAAEEHGYLLDLQGECCVSSLLCCAVLRWAGPSHAALSRAVLHCAELVCASWS